MYRPRSSFPVGPYGVRKFGDITFEKSVHDPSMRLARLVGYIRRYMKLNGRGPTRSDILQNVFSVSPIGRSSGAFRGWSGQFFSGAREAGFISHHKMGPTVLYELGPRAKLVRLK